MKFNFVLKNVNIEANDRDEAIIALAKTLEAADLNDYFDVTILDEDFAKVMNPPIYECKEVA